MVSRQRHDQRPTPRNEEGLVDTRLPGPAGTRSPYDEAALDDLAGALRGMADRENFCVLSNIEGHANGIYQRERLAGG